MQSVFLHYFLLTAYLSVLFLVCLYGLHRYSLVYLYYKYRNNVPKLKSCFRQYPIITVQLPMYNERFVAQRIIERTCQIDYPRNRLHVQVLDDSTDETTEIARRTVMEMRRLGHDVELLHRDNRYGFKAGALQQGLESAKGEFVCIFDADFIPTPQVLKDTIHFFTEPSVGMVQARWGHANRKQSLLTEIQAILLDGHFIMEHGARNRSGRFMSFNGTAGIWRKSCIADAGGWQHDTLTEDLDLSYRAQMKGWSFLFVPSTEVPAELPPEMEGFKAQQYRWTKGGAQTCKKLLPTILKSDLPWRIKLEAFWHLTSNMVYSLVVVLSVLLFPALTLKLHLFQEGTLGRLLFDCSLLMIATFSASSFYICSQRELSKSWWDSIKYLPALMGLGVGIAINNSRAMIHGLFGHNSDFVRTPKYGLVGESGFKSLKDTSTYVVARDFEMQPWIELAMGLYMSVCVVACLSIGRLSIGVPFLIIFTFGYLYVSLSTLLGPWLRRRMLRARSQPLSVA